MGRSIGGPLLWVLLLAAALTGCAGGGAPDYINEVHLELAGVREVAIAYDWENVTVLEGEGDELVLREHMTADGRRYRAGVEQGDGRIRISGGTRPLLDRDFSRSVEIRLPAGYGEGLSITTTDGAIDLTGADLVLRALRCESTSGTVQIGRAEAREITLATTRGTVACGALRGRVSYTTTSGDLVIESAAGSGDYRAENSGALEVAYVQVDGALSLYNKNGDIALTIPADLEFTFEAGSKNGTVTTTFQDCLAARDGVYTGRVGAAPAVSVHVEARNGNIRVTR